MQNDTTIFDHLFNEPELCVCRGLGSQKWKKQMFSHSVSAPVISLSCHKCCSHNEYGSVVHTHICLYVCVCVYIGIIN